MDTQAVVKTTPYLHINLSGSAYQVGRAQGEALKSTPGWINFLKAAPGTFPEAWVNQAIQAFETHCPSISEEIRGLADGIGIPYNQILYFALSHLPAYNCSHLVVLPPASADGHLRVARNFEFSDKANDYRLCTTQIEGRYRHIGSSIMLFGRAEGINEHGLVVTSTSGGMPVGGQPGQRKPEFTGFQFYVLNRHLLETCRNVEEALAAIETFPLSANPILMVADRSGQAAMIELFGPKRAVRRINLNSPEPYLYATNHYTTPEMQPYLDLAMKNSLVRRESIRQFVAAQAPQISKQNLLDLFSGEYPQGLSCGFYDEYFGTLYSALFDITEGTAEYCFGYPGLNPWRTFDLKQPAGFQVFPSQLSMQRAPADFFEMQPIPQTVEAGS